MPNVGDGTGEDASPPEVQGATANQNRKPNPQSPPYGSGDGGVGFDLDPKGNRSSPLNSPSKKPGK